MTYFGAPKCDLTTASQHQLQAAIDNSHMGIIKHSVSVRDQAKLTTVSSPRRQCMSQSSPKLRGPLTLKIILKVYVHTRKYFYILKQGFYKKLHCNVHLVLSSRFEVCTYDVKVRTDVTLAENLLMTTLCSR